MSRTIDTNAQALKQSVSTDDLQPGGAMPREVFDEFFRAAVDQTPLLDAVRTVDIGSPKTRIPKFGVGERQRRGQAEDATGARGSVEAGYVDIDAKKGTVSWGLTAEVVENHDNGEELADFILSRMSEQFGVDTQEIAIRGDEAADTGDADLDDFLQQNNGFIRIAQDRGMPQYSHADGSDVAQPVNNDLFSGMRAEMPEKYASRGEPVYLVSSRQLHTYREFLSGNYDAAGFQVLMGDSELTPFNYPVMGLPHWPDDKAMLTDPENLIYALFRDVEMDVLTESDEISEKDLFAKYFLRAKDDFQIENVDAGVLATDIAAP